MAGSQFIAGSPKSEYWTGRAPTVTDDNTAGFVGGSRWFDTSGQAIYECVNAAAGAAVWQKTAAVGFVPGQGSTGPMGLPGADGIDGEDGIPGPPGPTGAAGASGGAGAAGRQGIMGFGMDGEDGEDGWPIPGPQGPKGDTGATGAAGSGGVMHGCRVFMSAANQSIANNTVVVIPMDGSRYDTDGYHSNTVNNTRITIPAGMAGYYTIHAISQWAAFGGTQTGLINMFVQINGTGNQIASTAYLSPAGGSNVNQLNVGGDYYLNVGDYIEVGVYQFTGVGCTVNKSTAASQLTEFMVHLIGT